MDPYLILGVSKGCNRQEVKDAFRARARQLHPDRGGEDVPFIRLRNAYEQILVELGDDLDSNAESPSQVQGSESRPPGSGPGVAGNTYESWLRHVAAQADRSQSERPSARTRKVGMMVLLGVLAVYLATYWIVWSTHAARPSVANPVDSADELPEQDTSPALIRRAVTPVGGRRWQKPPAQVTDFFVVPYDAILFVTPVESDGGRDTEFGIVTAQGDVFPVFTGLPARPNPAREVEIGPLTAGSKLRIYLKKGTSWVFSDAAESEQSLKTFSDRDNSLGGGGSIIERVAGPDTWIVHLDDVDSTDDDDDDILIQIRLGPKEEG